MTLAWPCAVCKITTLSGSNVLKPIKLDGALRNLAG